MKTAYCTTEEPYGGESIFDIQRARDELDYGDTASGNQAPARCDLWFCVVLSIPVISLTTFVSIIVFGPPFGW
jgi:hypothetical protein